MYKKGKTPTTTLLPFPRPTREDTPSSSWKKGEGEGGIVPKSLPTNCQSLSPPSLAFNRSETLYTFGITNQSISTVKSIRVEGSGSENPDDGDAWLPESHARCSNRKKAYSCSRDTQDERGGGSFLSPAPLEDLYFISFLLFSFIPRKEESDRKKKKKKKKKRKRPSTKALMSRSYPTWNIDCFSAFRDKCGKRRRGFFSPYSRRPEDSFHPPSDTHTRHDKTRQTKASSYEYRTGIYEKKKKKTIIISSAIAAPKEAIGYADQSRCDCRSTPPFRIFPCLEA
ncbi:hypothetical protein L249_2312 [Ophiocordyceps polyrhachis-furcata BCC 54312]|uniref:Uncharacterized protein n=1 Tax=Ophiocordyceps polyrhachis-furcata BCC 54312 TaxID=1330021 RepID=A0A367LP69_9HYPO|nr:hypothetical protein L249_2312 [Ophiocordyceps polyrhachis-furcata BCC 54312]